MTTAWKKTLWPALVLGGALIATTAVVVVQPEAHVTRPELRPPLVRVIEVAPERAILHVRAQGSVEPRMESDLVIEVAGRIEWVSPKLAAGGFFEAGEALLRLDPVDHQVARERALASLERARSEAKLRRITFERRSELRSAGASSNAAVDEAESAAGVAAANLRDARAALRQADLGLARATVSAPFDGRVREQWVGVGQFVSRGHKLARVFAVDYAEVRLPIPSEELAFLDLPRDPGPAGASPEWIPEAPAPQVKLIGSYAGNDHEWSGTLVRTEGTLDLRTRMVNAVVRVDAHEGSGAAPLPIGLFVEAEIEGRAYDDLVALPRAALRGEDHVVVIDDDSRMQLRRVRILRRDGETIWLRDGVAAGERVCVTRIDVAVDGMRVRVASPPQAEVAARGSSS